VAGVYPPTTTVTSDNVPAAATTAEVSSTPTTVPAHSIPNITTNESSTSATVVPVITTSDSCSSTTTTTAVHTFGLPPRPPVATTISANTSSSEPLTTSSVEPSVSFVSSSTPIHINDKPHIKRGPFSAPPESPFSKIKKSTVLSTPSRGQSSVINNSLISFEFSSPLPNSRRVTRKIEGGNVLLQSPIVNTHITTNNNNSSFLDGSQISMSYEVGKEATSFTFDSVDYIQDR
jgi:hypothetical protein